MKRPLRAEIPFASLPDLLDCPAPPLTLWVEYRDEKSLELLKRLPTYGLGVVGSRVPQARSRALMETVFRALARTSLVIVSGLARGIDAEAHELALDFKLPTIGILAHGLDIHYPAETSELRERILNSGGLVVTEYAPQVNALRHQFIQRNRLIAGFSRAVWVVQAGRTSGALNTAIWAREAERTVYVTPSFPGDPSMAGNEFLLKESFASMLFSAESFGSSWIEHYAELYRSSNKPHRKQRTSATNGDSLFND